MSVWLTEGTINGEPTYFEDHGINYEKNCYLFPNPKNCEGVVVIKRKHHRNCPSILSKYNYCNCVEGNKWFGSVVSNATNLPDGMQFIYEVPITQGYFSPHDVVAVLRNRGIL